MNRLILSILILPLSFSGAFAQEAKESDTASQTAQPAEQQVDVSHKADPQAAIEGHRKAFFERIEERKRQETESKTE